MWFRRLRSFASQAKLNRDLRRASDVEFLDLAEGKAAEMDLANVVVSLGRITKMSHGAQGLQSATAALLSCVDEKLVACSSWHSLSNLAWALQRLDMNTEGLMALILDRAMCLSLAAAPGRDLPVLLWALVWARREGAKLDMEPFILELIDSLLLRLPEFSPQGLSMLLWSLATLEGLKYQVPKQTYRALLEQVEPALVNLKPREVANITWSLATVQVAMPNWLLEELPERALKFGPQECANVLWSLAVAAQQEVMLSFVQRLEIRHMKLSAWKPQELASACWALALALRRQGDVLSELRRHAVLKVDELQGKELSMLATAMVPGEEDLAERIARRGDYLQGAQQLAPDAIVQLRDHLSRVGMPLASLERAVEQLEENIFQVLQAPDVASKLPTLGLTSLGMRSAELFGRLGMGSDVREEFTRQPAAGQVLCFISYDLHGGEKSLAASRVVPSGSTEEGSSLRSVTLRFPRHRDAEFLALSWLLKESQNQGLDSGVVRLHATHTPCLSCVWAMVQFRQQCPGIQLHVTFDS